MPPRVVRCGRRVSEEHAVALGDRRDGWLKVEGREEERKRERRSVAAIMKKKECLLLRMRLCLNAFRRFWFFLRHWCALLYSFTTHYAKRTEKERAEQSPRRLRNATLENAKKKLKKDAIVDVDEQTCIAPSAAEQNARATTRSTPVAPIRGRGIAGREKARGQKEHVDARPSKMREIERVNGN